MNGSVMVPALAALSGLCWTIVYVDCLRLGIKQRTYAMPFWAVGLNLAWEGVHTVVGYREEGPSLQVIINGRTISIDATVLYARRQDSGPFTEPGIAVKFTRIMAVDREFIRQYARGEVTRGIVAELPEAG